MLMLIQFSSNTFLASGLFRPNLTGSFTFPRPSTWSTLGKYLESLPFSGPENRQFTWSTWST